MGEGGGWWGRGPAAMAPPNMERGGGGIVGGGGEEKWRNLDSSVDALSFGFVATAILIFMFLVMAIFERFLRPRTPPTPPPLPSSPERRRRRRWWRGATDLDAGSQHHQRGGFSGKLDYPYPKMSVYAKGVSVLMPGQDIPTFIAHPAPAPCPPERIISWPTHHQHTPILVTAGSTTTTTTISNLNSNSIELAS